MFGGVAAMFSQDGKNLIPVMITLVLGILLALLSNEGKNLLTEEGKWEFISKM